MEKFPVTESTLSAFDLGQFLQEKYNLSSKSKCKLFRTGINHLYLVSDGESKFVLRIYTLDWRTKLQISEELRLLNHLREKDVQVSYPILDQKGQFIQEIDAPEGVRYGVLFSFAEGHKIAKFTTLTSYHIGVVMGKMHQATENFELKRTTYNEKTLLADSFDSTRSFFTNDSDEITFIKNTINFLTKEYKKVNANEVRYGAMHLDIWFDNMHLKGEDGITLFDFDFCGNGWLCHDIAYFMLQLYNTNQGENEYELKLESFLKGYESIARISDEEKRIIPLAAVSIWLFYLGVQCNRFDNWSNIFLNEDHLKRFIGSIKRWIAYNKIGMPD